MLPGAQTGAAVEQLAFVPPWKPMQLQLQGPSSSPVTVDAVPTEQRFAGWSMKARPLAPLQTPLTGVGTMLAAQSGDEAPPFNPPQIHDHGPEPKTGTGVAPPAAQRLTVGAAEKLAPWAAPQEPGTGVLGIGALQTAVPPPFDPLQVHDHGPNPVTALAVPPAQRFWVGAADIVVLWEDPQTPSGAAMMGRKPGPASLYTFLWVGSVT